MRRLETVTRFGDQSLSMVCTRSDGGMLAAYPSLRASAGYLLPIFPGQVVNIFARTPQQWGCDTGTLLYELRRTHTTAIFSNGCKAVRYRNVLLMAFLNIAEGLILA